MKSPMYEKAKEFQKAHNHMVKVQEFIRKAHPDNPKAQRKLLLILSIAADYELLLAKRKEV